MTKPDTIILGGTDPERLYLEDLEFDMDGRHVAVKKTVISDDVTNTVRLEDMIARHIGRYSLIGLFCRPGFRVLDIPCGSGYAADFLKTFGVMYDGLDIDPLTIEYARRLYGRLGVTFGIGNLTRPLLPEAYYHVIACIEGLEHIRHEYQAPLIAALHRALRPGGVLVISSPENKTGKSGPSQDNPDHLWELSRDDFVTLLKTQFPSHLIEIVTHKAVLDPGGLMTCFYGVCHKSE